MVCSITCTPCLCLFFFFKQKTAYELRISDWSSDVCSSDLLTWRFRFIVPPRQKSIVQVLQRGGECLKGPQKNNREQGQMAANRSRPLSPHLTIWRWGPHMLVSILHRMTGAGLATVGVVGLVWWLTAAAMGPAAYETFYACAPEIGR